MPLVFMSHSSGDKPFVRRLASRLGAHGVQVWLDEADLTIGESLIDRITRAIADCDYVVAVLSNTSVGSRWVRRELQIAVTKEIGDGKIIVLPVLIEDCAIPTFLSDKLYADFCHEDDFEASLSALLKSIGADKPAVKASTDAPRAWYSLAGLRGGLVPVPPVTNYEATADFGGTVERGRIDAVFVNYSQLPFLVRVLHVSATDDTVAAMSLPCGTITVPRRPSAHTMASAADIRVPVASFTPVGLGISRIAIEVACLTGGEVIGNLVMETEVRVD